MEKIIIGIIIGLAFSYFSDIKKNIIENSNEKGVIIKIYRSEAPKQREVTEFIEYDNSITFED